MSVWIKPPPRSRNAEIYARWLVVRNAVAVGKEFGLTGYRVRQIVAERRKANVQLP